ncbi:DUF1307 domain-containing protein [Streptococcus sp. 263_SSPC]|uniref:DUF1307 domain-containing protein n=1 Tax=Streptococcus sp. 263_SSPC TaxID=1579343 RepID=UPI00066093D4|nr:DUF1307 domain-containing protein [Streptococcus sp. 263_SSPC]MCP9467220.1 DUF1307 domain-containing protein [Candidatus Granulicatella sp. P6S_S16_bin.50.1]
MKTLKTSLVLLSSIFVLAACGQNNSVGNATETNQNAQEATQANTKQSKLNSANNQQSQEKAADNQQNKKKSNAQNSSNLPKDGEAVYKLEDNGNTTTLKYYFKDDIVYLQDAVYAFNPKEMGKTEEEIQKLLKKRHSIYDGVKGIESTIARKDGIYYHTLKIDYNNIDWKELHKRAPETFPNTNPSALKYSEAVPKLLEDGYVKQ